MLQQAVTMSELSTLARYLAGEFANREQAIAEPVWYVSLRLWHRPLAVPLFPEPGITFFAEQANILKLDQPYRPRIFHLSQIDAQTLKAQYYMPKQPQALRGAGQNPDILKGLAPDHLEFLPGCQLTITWDTLATQEYKFNAVMNQGDRCCFTYQDQLSEVAIGFTAMSTEFFSFDRGLDPKTGTALWGALMGPYHFFKTQTYESPN